MAVPGLRDGCDGIPRQAVGPPPRLAIILVNAALGIQRRGPKRAGHRQEHPSQPERMPPASIIQLHLRISLPSAQVCRVSSDPGFLAPCSILVSAEIG